MRRTALLKELAARKANAMLIINPADITYLTGCTAPAVLVMGGPKEAQLYTDTSGEHMAFEQVTEAKSHGKVEILCVKLGRTVISEAIAGAVKIGKAVAYDTNMTTAEVAAQLPDTKVPLEGLLRAAREIKDPGEVEKLRAAVRVSERAYQMFVALLRESDTEQDMTNAMESYLRRSGAAEAAVPTSATVGTRTAFPGGTPNGQLLSEGSKLMIRWGARCEYASFLTRTIKSPFGTAPSRRNKTERVGYPFEDVLAAVQAAQDAAIAVVKNGAPAATVDDAARQSLKVAKGRNFKDDPLDKYFVHGAGHGIGLSPVETPLVCPGTERVLASGMVLSIGVGVYIPDWGGVCVRDMVLVTDAGSSRLSNPMTKPII